MVESCILVPRVQKRKGTGVEENESALFKDIKNAIGDYDTAWQMWGYTKTAEFRKKYGKNVDYDEMGEVTFPSLIKVLGMEDEYNERKNAEEAARDYGFNTTVFRNSEEAIHQVNLFNSKEKKFVAVTQKVDNGYRINVLPKSAANIEAARQQSYNHALTKEIIDLLHSIGFDVSFVNNARYEGLFDPENATMHDGLIQIIRLARGIAGENALPEEFSHAIIEGLIEHPLVKRLLASLTDEQIHEILGSSYDRYNKEYDGNLLKMKKEAAGKMLGQYITEKGTISKPVMEEKKSLLLRIWGWVKKMFSKIKGSQIEDARQRAWDSIAGIYNLVASGEALPIIDRENILAASNLYKLQAEYNSLEKVADIGERIIAKSLVIERNRRDNYKKIKDSNERTAKYKIYGEVRESLKSIQELNSYEGDKAFESVMSFLVEAERQMNRIYADTRRADRNEKAGNMDTIHTINEAAKTMRDIDLYIQGYKDVIKTITTFDEDDNIAELGLPNVEAGQILANKALSCSRILDKLERWRQATAMNIVYHAARTVYKDDRVRGIGSKRDSIMSLNEIMKHAARDINFVDRWVSAMSDADDPYLVIFDSLVKNQQYERDMEMIEWKAQIAAADEKLRKNGYSSEFMFERKENGDPSGRIISEYDWDTYNKELKAEKERLVAAGYVGTEYYERLSKWKNGVDPKTKHLRLIKVFVDPEIDRLYREKGEKAVPEEAVFEYMPNPKVYNKNADRIKNLEPAQREYYNKMMTIKRQMMTKIPHRGQYIYRAIYISKDFAEGLLESKNPLKATAENFKKKFVRRPDDIGFGTHAYEFRDTIRQIVIEESDRQKAEDRILTELSAQLDDEIKNVIRPGTLEKIMKMYDRQAADKNTDEEKKDTILENTVSHILDSIASSDFVLVETDFANHRIQRLPIYYTRPLKDMKMLSTDFSGSLVAYSAMAVNYEKMNEVVDILEVGRSYINDLNGRGVREVEGNKAVMSRFSALGKAYHSFVEKAGNGSLIAGRMNDYMDSVVYEERKDNEGQINILGTHLDLAKTLDTIKDYTGLLGLGLNLFSTISNIAVGKLQQWIEAYGGEYFTFKDYAKACTQYNTLLWGHLMEISSPVKKNKLSLLIQMFDPMGDYYESLRDANLNKKVVSRILGNGMLAYIGMNAGEHMLHCQTMLAILNNIKLTDMKTKEKISLFDALEVKERNGIYRLELKPNLAYERELIDNTGVSNPESRNFNKNYGRPLKDKNGKIMTELVQVSGAEDLKDSIHTQYIESLNARHGTFDKDQKPKNNIAKNFNNFIFKKKKVVRKVNDSLNGAFSANDKGPIHKKAWGRLIMQFSQWMPAHYMRRFARAHYDADLEQWREGYYVTVGKTISMLGKDCKKAIPQLLTLKDTLNEHEKANLRRATAEVSEFLMLLALVKIGGRVKDRDRSWLNKMALYQIRRMYLEVGASVPLNPGTFFSNIFTILQSPAAAIDTFEKFTKILNIFNIMDEVQTGRYQGYTEWERDLYEALPFLRQIIKAIDFDDSMFSMFERD